MTRKPGSLRTLCLPAGGGGRKEGEEGKARKEGIKSLNRVLHSCTPIIKLHETMFVCDQGGGASQRAGERRFGDKVSRPRKIRFERT